MTEEEEVAKLVKIHQIMCAAIEEHGGCLSNIDQFIFWDKDGRAIYKLIGDDDWREIDIREEKGW